MRVFYAPGRCGLPTADCGMGCPESGWWSLSAVQAGQSVLCDRTVRADDFVGLTEETKPVVPAIDSSHGMMTIK